MPRNYDVQWAFTHKKQTAFGTPNIDGDLTLAAFFKGPDLHERQIEVKRDGEQFGRGHEWSEGQEIEVFDMRGRRSFDLNTRMAGHFLAFALGSIATSQPDGVGNPTVYDHIIKPQDATVSIQLPQMTIVEASSSGIKKKIQDLVVNTLEITGSGKDRLQFQADLVGSGTWAGSVLAMPAISAAKFLRMKDVKLEVGLYGGALTDFSSRLKSFRFRINNNLKLDDGYFPGSGQVRGRLEFDRREYELEFVILVDAASQELDRLEQNTNLAARITAEGEVISTTYNHRLIIDAPDIHYRTVPLGYENNQLVYRVTANINYDSAGGILYPVKCEVRNDVAAYLN